MQQQIFYLDYNQTRTEQLNFKLTDRIPTREIKIDVRAKLPDNTINELFAEDLPVDLLPMIDINTLITLKQSGITNKLYNNYKT